MRKTDKGIRGRIKSFGYAFTGICEFFKSEPNAKIHLSGTVCVVLVGFFFSISAAEWSIILIVTALVWASEAFNTAIEKLVDHLFKDYHETARKIKDLSAGAVLICAIAAFVCGIIIFLPKILDIL